MKTPTTHSGLRQYDHLPLGEAIYRAWTNEGKFPYIHRRAKKVVRNAMPLLSRALDRLEVELPTNNLQGPTRGQRMLPRGGSDD